MATRERIPPQNLEAEQSLLGSLLIDKDAVTKIADRVRPEDFYRESHLHIFEAMLQLYERHEPIDILSLGNRLEEQGHLQRVGGRAYLVELSNMVPTSANCEHYADIVQKKATLRRIITAATEITHIGYEEDEDV
ncbi:replicative DNA helicase, partial [Candidatus Uhrbacteria bacterium]|nr:replicative DNA helicase [Candidatus Uhrbacteria bacterium]